ncbi:MAG TPA: ZIP family metal transporter [Bacteriovoracaceae bacterium]|nr:ZIP family metal transporter [Bacteriovoracaceae bacterium]
MTWQTILGLALVTGGSTILGSLPVVFHRYLREKQWIWWESFGGGVMVSASVFSLFIPAYQLLADAGSSYLPLFQGVFFGALFIFSMALVIAKLTSNILHQRAFLFVFVMGLHNIPEGLAVGVDVAALGWKASMPLTIAIFIQNLPEGLVSSMSFLISGFSVNKSLMANAVTALIESVSSLIGYKFVATTSLGLPFLLSFAGACMMSVVAREITIKAQSAEAATFSRSGFGVGLAVCAVLDVIL